MNFPFNKKIKKHFNYPIDEEEIRVIDSNRIDIKENIEFKYLKDISYDVFDEIFSNMEFENMSGEKIKISDYKDFYDFQMNLKSNYKPIINSFDYKSRIKINILKEVPYKATKLRKMVEEDGAITVSPNGHFAWTSKIINESSSTLEHYNTVIGNSLILSGVYYFEIKILELGDNTDMCFGIIAKNSNFFNDKKYKNFPFCDFEDCYGFNLNNYFFDKFPMRKISLSRGTIISLKVDLNKGKIYIYFDGSSPIDNCIKIKDINLGYYPAFSLSSSKEIQVKFGGIYNLFTYFQSAYLIDAKPICQYNNLENIVSCYMKIIDNSLIKIINHQEILFNDSIRFFNPMINFFSNIAFNDEFIMKKYILKFMYKNYFEDKDIDIFFDERYNFLYLIMINIDKNKLQKNILFLLDCLCEEIKNESYIPCSSEKMPNALIYIKLYNYFLKKKLFKEILFPEGKIFENVSKALKSQFFIIFQSIRIFGINYAYINNLENVICMIQDKMIKFVKNKNYLDCFTRLIETLLGFKSEKENFGLNQINEIINKITTNNNNNKETNSDKNQIDDENNFSKDLEILENKLLKCESNNIQLKENNYKCFFIRKERYFEYNPYRQIFSDLIKDFLENKSNLNSYNIISTIYLPLLNLLNIYYEKENSSNFSNAKFLSYLPTLFHIQKYLKDSDSKILINENIKFTENSMKDIIDKSILSDELHKKQDNISSYLIKILIYLSSFFEQELFNFDLYFQNREYKKVIKEWMIEDDKKELNNFINNATKLILLNNEFNFSIVLRSLDYLIPYFSDLLKNNFYLFLPFKFVNMLRFFIKFFVCHYYIFKDDKTIKYKNISKLIKIFVDINFKLLFNKNTNTKFCIQALNNIKLLYNLFSFIKSVNNVNLNKINDLEECDEINESNFNDIPKFDAFIKESDLEKILKLLEITFGKKEKENIKYLSNFLFYFSPNIFSNSGSDKMNIFSSVILKKIKTDENDFWFKTFILKYLVKDNLIIKIKKTEDILNNIEEIEKKEKQKLIKYFTSIITILNFISFFIKDKIVLNKYFNYYLDDKDFLMEDDSGNSEDDEKQKMSIYTKFIKIAILIAKKILNDNFSNFCHMKVNSLNEYDYKVKYLINECFKYLYIVFVEIPKKYEELLKNKEKNEKKKKKNKKKNQEKENELNEDLKNYYTNIINNIKINDIMKFSTLLESNDSIISNVETHKSQLRKIIKFLNDIETKYNLMPKESHSKEDSQDANSCPICLDRENDVHLSPCDHKFCFDCIKKLTDNRCPICRINFNGVREHPEFRFQVLNQNQNRINVIHPSHHGGFFVRIHRINSNL